MPLFKKKQKPVEESNENSLPQDILEFLDEADNRYIRAYETRNLPCLKDYFTRECIIKLGPIIANTASLRYFSNSKFRVTDWTLSEKNGEVWSVTKSVTYTDIRVAGSMRMKVSNDYVEEWTLYVTDDEVLVSNVHLCQGV